MFKAPVTQTIVQGRELSLQGVEAMQQGRWEEAERLLAQSLEACPLDERAHARYARTLWRLERQDEAINHMQRAMKLSGGDPELLVELGQMHLALGAAENAGTYARQAIARNRRFAAAWALEGDALRQAGRLDQALARYHRSLSYDHRQDAVQIAVAEIYRRQDRPQRALATLQSITDRYAPEEAPRQALMLEGLALKRLQRYSDAAGRLRLAARRGEPTPDLLYQLADAQLAAGDMADARLTLLDALERAPQHAPSRELAAHIEGRRRRMAAAVPAGGATPQ